MASEIKVDTISEKTSANGVTIDGVSLKDSKIATANSVDSDAYVDGSIDAAHIASDAVTTAKILNDNVTAAKMADNSIDSDAYVDASIDNAHLADNAVDTAEIADNAVTLAKMAGLARGKLIYGDASGDPAALAVGGADEVLTHDGTDLSWAAAAGGGASDYFFAYKAYTDIQTLSNVTLTKVTFGTEIFDSGSDFASSTYTAPSNGKYFFSTQVCHNSGTEAKLKQSQIVLYINDVYTYIHNQSFAGNPTTQNTISASFCVDLSATDTVDVYSYMRYDSAATLTVHATSTYADTHFLGWRIGD